MKQHGPRFEALVSSVMNEVQEIGAAELVERLQGPLPPVVVDVREDHEWEEGRIPGSVHLGRGILERDAEATWPDPATELVLYCGGGFRSALAAQSLQLMGYSRVRSLAGGRRGWIANGLPWEVMPAGR